jgi:chromosome segregation ATPase
MRTSTVAFLVLFLCLASSADRRSALRGFVGEVKQTVHAIVDEIRGEHDAHASGTRALKHKLEQIDERYGAASKTVRAVDRSLRQLRDRLDDLRDEAAHGCSSRVVIDSAEALAQQIRELDAEREKLVALQVALKNERVQVQTALDLESVRDERRELEALLERGVPQQYSPSPLDRMAAAQETRGVSVYVGR